MVFQDPMTSLSTGSCASDASSPRRYTSSGRVRARHGLQRPSSCSPSRLPARPTPRLRFLSPRAVPGGMRRSTRSCIAMALACQAKLLVADEPAARIGRRRPAPDPRPAPTPPGRAGNGHHPGHPQPGHCSRPHRRGHGHVRRPHPGGGTDFDSCSSTCVTRTPGAVFLDPPHRAPSPTRLSAIPGRPSNVMDPSPG